MVEASDDRVYVLNGVIGVVMNSLFMLQFILYRNNNSASQAGNNKVDQILEDGKEKLIGQDALDASLLEIDPEKALEKAQKVKNMFGEVIN